MSFPITPLILRPSGAERRSIGRPYSVRFVASIFGSSKEVPLKINAVAVPSFETCQIELLERPTLVDRARRLHPTFDSTNCQEGSWFSSTLPCWSSIVDHELGRLLL